MGRKRHTPEQINHCTAGGRGRSGPRQIREADQPGARHQRADVLPVERRACRVLGQPRTTQEWADYLDRCAVSSS